MLNSPSFWPNAAPVSAALASFGTLAALAAPDERAELFTVALVIAYVAFSVPAVIAGLATGAVGLHATALAYGVVVAALSATALAAQRLRARVHGQPRGQISASRRSPSTSLDG